uniref:Uncharacterized protein n=1 Tax=candidate division WOR-3 bacterium TaxID=2052148 RepID=A0A7C6EH75_UNCW3
MRPVIWTILAILVVAAIVFVVIARKGATPDRIRREMTPEAYTKFADRMEKNIATYEERLAKLTEKGISPQAQPMVDQYNAKLNELKEAVADLRANPTEQKVEKIRATYKELRKIFHDLGGAESGEEGEE